MSTSISLLQMPKVPMEHILEYLDFPSILVLRKVCHDLRNFIDQTKPASHLTEIDVDVYGHNIAFNLLLPRTASTRFSKKGEGCLVMNFSTYETIERTIDEDFVTVFCKDFDIVLRHQKTVLEKFCIRIHFVDSSVKERVLEGVKKSLKSMDHPLQVKLLYMGVNNHNEILPILPYTDPKQLKKIHIYEPSGRENNMLNLNEIGQMEQWKQAKELVITGFQVPYLSQNLKHFSRIVLHFQEDPIEFLISLKEMFLSSTLDFMATGNLSQDVIRQRLVELFGEPFLGEHRDENWFFRISDTNQFLRITQKCYQIHFNRIEQSDVPQNAIILN